MDLTILSLNIKVFEFECSLSLSLSLSASLEHPNAQLNADCSANSNKTHDPVASSSDLAKRADGRSGRLSPYESVTKQRTEA